MKEVVKYFTTTTGDCFEYTVTWVNSEGQQIYKYKHYGMEDIDVVLFDYRDSNCEYVYDASV